MEKLFFEKTIFGSKTICPHKKNVKVGTHFCKYCEFNKGMNNNFVLCNYSNCKVKTKMVSFDVMIEDKFVRTIKVIPKGFYIKGERMQRVLIEEDIISEVKERCPLEFMKNWHVEIND